MEAMDVKYRPVLFPNGAVKKLKPASVPAPAPAPVGAGAAGELVYRECLKNHAASMGGHALDGCGEFMPSPAANPSDPTSLKCAACGCHRNFHRRFAEASPSPPPPAQQTMPAALPPPHLLHGHPHRRDEPLEDRLPAAGDDDSYDSDDGSDYDEDRSASPAPPPPPPQPQAYFSSAPHMLLALSSGAPSAPTPASRLPAPAPAPASAPLAPGPAAVARKRFRTKFSPEQKQRMQELSERLGWRLQKRDEAVVDECCREIGVGKGVFKVWMHNNKHNFLGGHSARRSASASAAAAAAAIHPSNPIPTPTAAPQTNTTDFNINGAAVANLADLHASGHPANGGSPPSS